MKLINNFISKKKFIYALAILFIIVLLIMAAAASIFAAYHNKFFPNTYIAGLNISASTKDQAKNYLNQKLIPPESIILFTSYNDEAINYPFNLADIEFRLDIAKTVDQVYESSRSDSYFVTFKNFLNSAKGGSQNSLVYTYNKKELQSQLSVIAETITDEAVEPNIEIEINKIVVYKGQAGNKLDLEEIISQIEAQFSSATFESIAISPIKVDPTISDERAQELEAKAQKYLNKYLLLKFEFEEFVLSDDDLVDTIAIHEEGYNNDFINHKIDEVGSSVNRQAQNPVFVFENNKVVEFSPAKDGIEIDKQKLFDLIVDQLEGVKTNDTTFASIDIPTKNSPPDFNTADINDLGIKELIGRGTSRFRGSISSRVHNVALATSRLNGVLIKPGETFSFNAALGDVSKYTGYKEAYVIQDGKTVLGDGGGVCQVSTTFFRAALDAGLPIIERRAHSYRVGYYEQDNPPGLDATVYSPVTDLKVKNDTPAHILIQANVDTTNMTMYFELYGTSDGREATVTKPVIYETSPAPEDVYVDDPTLPEGQIKQVEYRASGAKSRFDYTVVRDGQTLIEKTFYSSYRPWAAVYLRGVGPASE